MFPQNHHLKDNCFLAQYSVYITHVVAVAILQVLGLTVEEDSHLQDITHPLGLRTPTKELCCQKLGVVIPERA